MKKMKIFNILFVVLVLVISMECIAYADDAVIKSQGKIVFDNNTAETADDVIFDASDLTTLDTMVKTGKANISSAINEYPNTEVASLDTFDNLTDAINRLTAVPDIYYYDKATEGDDCTRYMYENGSYYPCDEYGVKTSTTALSGTITVVAKDNTTEPATGETQLVKYVAMSTGNLSAGSAGYVDKTFLLGSGSDNINYKNLGYAQGYADGQANAGEIQYIYHTHELPEGATLSIYNSVEVSDIQGLSCYQTPVYHKHKGNTTNGGACYQTEIKCSGYYCTTPNDDSAVYCLKCGDWRGSYYAGKPCEVVTGYSKSCRATTSTIEGYKCEKIEGVTIDGAIIVFE